MDPGPLRAEHTYVCLDPTAYGHVGLYDRRTAGGPGWVDSEPHDGGNRG